MQELIVELKNVRKSYLNKEIIKIEHLTVYQNERIGIVGKNGQGKSTLMNIISKALMPEEGTVQTTVDFQYYRQMEDINEHAYEEVDPALLGRLHIPKHQTTDFSGGEEARFRLAKAFSGNQMGLLMDEPTTHLDVEGVRFLIDELKYYYGTLLVVSHDRYFLDQVVEKIWEVEDGSVTVYEGNYSDYVEQKTHHQLEQRRAYEQFTKEKERLQQSAQKKQAQAQKMNKVSQKQKNKRIKPNRLAASKQKDTVQKAAHKAAKAIEKRMDQMGAVEKVVREKELKFPDARELEMHNPFPIMIENVTIQKGNRTLLDQVSAQFPLGKRIGLVGPNGSGKSSLIQHVLLNGEGITLSPKVVFSTYHQMDYKSLKGKNLLEFLAEDSDFQEPVLRAVLNNLAFSQVEIMKPLDNISGGEATRLAIAKLFTRPSNVLVLDEPTNFIDLQTIEALENLMRSYKGTILFTSHDEYFMKNMAEQVWEIKDEKLLLKEEN